MSERDDRQVVEPKKIAHHAVLVLFDDAQLRSLREHRVDFVLRNCAAPIVVNREDPQQEASRGTE
jgi:hypothetical protein